MPSHQSRRAQWVFALVALTAGAAVTGYAAARESLKHHPPAPILVSAPPMNLQAGPRPSGGRVAPASAAAATTAVPCTQAPPDPTFTCQNDVWAAGKNGTEAPGGGGPGRSAGCVSAQPNSSLVCQNGIWVVPANSSGTDSSSTAVPPVAPTSSTSTAAGSATSAACSGSAPSVGWVCSGGVWVLKT